MPRIRLALAALLLMGAVSARAQDPARLRAQGRLGEAAALAERRAAEAPDDATALLEAARAQMAMSRYDLAEPYLARVEALDSARTGPAVFALVLRGRAAYARGLALAARDRWLAVDTLHSAPDDAQAEARALLRLTEAREGWEAFPNPGLLIRTPPLQDFPQSQSVITTRLTAYMALAPFFTTDEPKRIDYYVWPSAEAARRWGIEVGYVDPTLSLVHTSVDRASGYEIALVLLHRAAKPTYVNRFIAEGTATLFDMTNRDRMAVARQAVRGARRVTVRRLWEAETAPDSVAHAVGAAFVERLVKEQGRDRFLEFLRDQSVAHARQVYGADVLDRIVSSVDADLRRR